MQFILIAHDKAGALPLRMATRAAHLTYLEQRVGPNLLFAGPLLDDDGNPKGSVAVVEATNMEEAQNFYNGDPYMEAGLFAEFSINRFRLVFSNGGQI